MNKKLRSVLLRLLLDERVSAMRRASAEILRRLSFRKPVVSIFLQLDDPYSYLLAHYLPAVVERYRSVVFRFYICQALRGDHMPQPALLAEYAMHDCELLAREYGVPFLDRGKTPAVEFRRKLLAFLADEQNEPDFGETLMNALTLYWRGDTEGVSRLTGHTSGETATTHVLIGQNQLLLRKLGHYNCATMHFASEWYWGVDRIDFLIERFDSLGFSRVREVVPELASLAQAKQMNLPAAVPARAEALPALEYFHSFRSPYSYLGLQQAIQIADAFGMRLDLRPVLPMVMRGLKVPQAKLRYILSDANREARRMDVPFGSVADPLGSGVERCMAAFAYAKSQNREREFVVEAGRAIFANGIDVATDEGMQIVAEKCGLFWPEFSSALTNDDWRENEQRTREDLDDIGHWGVPVLKVGDLAFWGQDRGWLMARQIEDLCHGGEGIMI